MSSRSHRGHGEEHAEAENSERWLLTYADMITLLLALFVVLFAMSTINIQKFMEFKTGVVKSFSTLQLNSVVHGGTGLLQNTSLVQRSGVVKGIVPPINQSSGNSNATAQAVNAALQKAGLASDASVTTDQRGVVVTMMSDKMFFGVDSAQLGTAGSAVVDVLASVLKPMTNDVVVEGYTDDQPIMGGPYSSNFELSAVRATTVVERMTRVDGIPEARLSATGYGQTHPLVPNTSPANMAINRRVDVVILNPAVSSVISPSTPVIAPVSAVGTGNASGTIASAAPSAVKN